MATAIATQRDQVINLKKETFANLRLLNEIQPMPRDLKRPIFMENAVEKLTQNVFNHLAYYLVSIVDYQASKGFSLPQYDTKTEKTYRNEISAFIAKYPDRKLLSPVMSSYLVNPACFKVTVLIFQLSQLAVQRVLESNMRKERQKTQYHEITNMLMSQKVTSEVSQEAVNQVIDRTGQKRTNYLRKRALFEKMAEMMRSMILENHEFLAKTNAQGYIDNLVDGFIKTCNPDKETKGEVLMVKNVNEEPKIFDKFLAIIDTTMDQIEAEWQEKTTPFIKLCKETLQNTELVLARQTGADQKLFAIEYNHRTDEINTDELQKHVNSEQKYILKNIARDQKLSFPNLIRGFLISMSFIMKNTIIDEDIYRFNEYLELGHLRYSEIICSLKSLVERVMNSEHRLKFLPNISEQSVTIPELTEIPPLPDLSGLKMTRVFYPPALLQMSRTKKQFNLRHKMSETFKKPLSKSFMVTPIHRGPSEEFLKSVISCRVSAYDQMSVTQVNHHMSQIADANVTMPQNTGFTKQQLNRLFSTKKSSTKKFKHNLSARPDIKIKKGNLFNETMMTTFNESSCLIRSHSSPNLLESKDMMSRLRKRLPTMKEDSLQMLEFSGITALDKDSKESTPRETCSLKVSRKVSDFNSTPSITYSSPKSSTTDLNKSPVEVPKRKSAESYKCIPSVIITPCSSPKSPMTDLNKKSPVEIPNRKCAETYNCIPSNIISPCPSPKPSMTDLNKKSPVEIPKRKSAETFEEHKTETPASNARLIKKTGSLEKIINRFKKIRASVLPDVKCEEIDFRIDEEKENHNILNEIDCKTNRNLLPDLLSPSCSTITQRSNDLVETWFDSDDDLPRRPRESLGTALGVDHTFLDQFDIDSD